MTITRTLIVYAFLAVLLAVLASCGSKEGGWYQGGGDDSPRWRTDMVQTR